MRFDDAPCIGKTNLFFSELREVQGTTTVEQRERLRKRTAAAKAICAECPYQEPCLELGVRNEKYGIWGGKDPEELAAIRKERGLIIRRVQVQGDPHFRYNQVVEIHK